jgi:hypothetical protein
MLTMLLPISSFASFRPHFVDFGDYHISYENFREALRPRGYIDTHVMELFIRHFNSDTNDVTTTSHMCTKFAFSQSFTVRILNNKIIDLYISLKTLCTCEKPEPNKLLLFCSKNYLSMRTCSILRLAFMNSGKFTKNTNSKIRIWLGHLNSLLPHHILLHIA